METLVHGTCVALGGDCALLRGPPGAGKSDLALRFLYLPETSLGAKPALVADDQVVLRRKGGNIFASCPPALSGKIEVRGVGIMTSLRYRPQALLLVLVDLDGAVEMPRHPACDEQEPILDVPVRRFWLDPFEMSAPIKLALLLQRLAADPAA